MKKMVYLLVLLGSISYSQEATIHFYGSSKLLLGSEILVHVNDTDSFYLGGGFSGATNVKEVTKGHINEYDQKYTVNSFNEEWCSIYGTTSFGFFKSVLIKFKGGLGVYNKKVDFKNSNGYEYTKIDKVVYQPLLGMSAMYSLTKDIGIEIGVDSFNKATIGFTVLF